MNATMNFLRTLRMNASGLWTVDVAALDHDKTLAACQARTAVFQLAYERGLNYRDIARGFGWYSVRRKFSRSDVALRHATMLVVWEYRDRFGDLSALADTYPVTVTIPTFHNWRAYT